jgi:deoxyribodipyrimidine photo-lyase
MTEIKFPTSYSSIIERVGNINPIEYAHSRNFINGSVSYLSPYISRGVISPSLVVELLKGKGYGFVQAQKFIQELAWREYFQRVWQHLEDDMFEDIRHRFTGVQHRQIPVALLKATTSINTVDAGINSLYNSGYMHNHLRMYTASIACNIGKANWQLPAQWMYYHLLDGDLASNTCSWQWVAGTFSANQYYCNQENINKYTGCNQKNTFLDTAYDQIPHMAMPAALIEKENLPLQTKLPIGDDLLLDYSQPLILYNSYNLDPTWRNEIKANRLLLLEPSHFKKHPVSEKVMAFIIALAKNITDLQIFTGEVNEIPGLSKFSAVYAKEHPAFKHYPGKKDERDWLFPEVTGYHNSFFSYWRNCERTIRAREKASLNSVNASL